MDLSPEQTAKELIEINFPIEKYEELQSRRNTRLMYWKEHGIQALIDKESELIKFGEKVLTLMKEAYGKG